MFRSNYSRVIVLVIALGVFSPRVSFASCGLFRSESKSVSRLTSYNGPTAAHLNQTSSLGELILDLRFSYNRSQQTTRDYLKTYSFRDDKGASLVDPIVDHLKMISEHLKLASEGKTPNNGILPLQDYLILRHIAMEPFPPIVARGIPFSVVAKAKLSKDVFLLRRWLRKKLTDYKELFKILDDAPVFEAVLARDGIAEKYIILDPALRPAGPSDARPIFEDGTKDYRALSLRNVRREMAYPWVSKAGDYQIGARFKGKHVVVRVQSEEGTGFVSGEIDGVIGERGKILVIREERSGEKVLIGIEGQTGLKIYAEDTDSFILPPMMIQFTPTPKLTPERFLEIFRKFDPTLPLTAREDADKMLQITRESGSYRRAILVQFPEGKRVLTGWLEYSESLNKGRLDAETAFYRLKSDDGNHYVIAYNWILAYTQVLNVHGQHVYVHEDLAALISEF